MTEVTPLDHSDEIGPYQGESWDELLADAQQAKGTDHVKGDVLVGIPHMITSFTMREGDFPHGVFKDKKLIEGTGCGKKHPYLYLDAVIAPERELKRAVARGRVTEDAILNVDPGEALGFIEAGTGFYRQFLAFLEDKEFVTLPEGQPDGTFGESRFDSLPQDWEFHKGDIRWDENGEPVWTGNVRLYLPRGLRVSEYENEYTGQARTRYAG